MKADTRISTNRDLIIEALGASTKEAWDAFVHETPGGLPHHLGGWADVMRLTYGYPTHYFMARDQEGIKGVMPLFLVPSRLTGRRLMTMPGGLCAADDVSAQTLLGHANTVAKDLGIGRVVVQDSRETWSTSWCAESEHVYWLLALPDEEEELWEQLDGNIRRQVRKARKNGLRAEIDRQGQSLDAFYEMFCRFTHHAGTPVFAREFLRNIVRIFPGGFSIALVWKEETPIAGYFQLEMGDTMFGMWGAALPDALKLRPAYLAIWEIMRDAINTGFSFLDMGRSPADSNASKYKGQWGGVSSPVYQLSNCVDGASGNDSVTNRVQSDQRFQLFIRLWPKLPLSVTRRLGPHLRRHIPFA